MNYGYIYKTTNLINGRIYIGKKVGTINISYLGSGKIINLAIDKYGKENFKIEVIAFSTTDLMLCGLERKYIYEYRQVYGKDFLYNISIGGEGGNGNLGIKSHKNECICGFCKSANGFNKGKKRPASKLPRKKPIHKDNCKCYICKAKRGETYGVNNPMFGKKPSLKCLESIKNAIHKLDCNCFICKSKRGELKGNNNPNSNYQKELRKQCQPK